MRYAGYQEEGSEKGFSGIPANVEMTEYLIANNLWTPPEKKTAFDVLPLVLKEPGRAKPYIHTLPPDCLFEVTMEHPTCPAFKSLGLRWSTVPAISNFKMTLGGVTYPNMPFNGWFVSTEVVRNLMERYDIGPTVAELFWKSRLMMIPSGDKPQRPKSTVLFCILSRRMVSLLSIRTKSVNPFALTFVVNASSFGTRMPWTVGAGLADSLGRPILHGILK